jgi:hypothetical protein
MTLRTVHSIRGIVSAAPPPTRFITRATSSRQTSLLIAQSRSLAYRLVNINHRMYSGPLSQTRGFTFRPNGDYFTSNGPQREINRSSDPTQKSHKGFDWLNTLVHNITLPSDIIQVLSFFFRMIRGVGRIVRAVIGL